MALWVWALSCTGEAPLPNSLNSTRGNPHTATGFFVKSRYAATCAAVTCGLTNTFAHNLTHNLTRKPNSQDRTQYSP